MTYIANYTMGNKTSRTNNNSSIHNTYEYNPRLAFESVGSTMTGNTNAATPTSSRNASMQPPRPPNQQQASHNRPPQKTAKRQKPAFRQKVSASNQTAICTTTSQKVGRRTLRELLESPREAYSVPIFQRRYCWNQTQWDTLWHDVWKRRSLKHSLGRLTCTNALEQQQQQQQRSIIIDGQQRFTTTTLLLAAIRDALFSLNNNDDNGHATEALVQSIHEMLFLDPKSMEDWTAKSSTSISEGLPLEFCRLVPTFCDRSSYLAAILPPNAPQVQAFWTETYRPSWHRPLVAKEHFARHIHSLLEGSSSPLQVLEKLTKLLLDGIDILYFPIDVHKGYTDGTEDTQVIYERLAIRDATWCKPRRKSEYHSMDGADMIRNLCLGSFHHTQSKTRFYEQYWLPLERMFQTTLLMENDDDEDIDGEEEESLKQVLVAFVKDPTTTQAFAGSNTTTTTADDAPRVVGGRIYRDFETWMARDFEQWQQQRPTMLVVHHHRESQTGLSPSEEHTMDVGRRLLEFATRRAQSMVVHHQKEQAEEQTIDDKKYTK